MDQPPTSCFLSFFTSLTVPQLLPFPIPSVDNVQSPLHKLEWSSSLCPAATRYWIKSVFTTLTNVQLYLSLIVVCTLKTQKVILSPKMETTHISINRWVNEQSVVYAHNGTVFSHKKEHSSDTCYNMGAPCKHQAQWKKSFPADHILNESIYMKCP